MEKIYVYRYKLLENSKEVQRGWTYDVPRREVECLRMHPRATFHQVGGRVTIEKARIWEAKRQQPISIEVASIQTQNYKEVIEIRVPIRFYWNRDGSFDGVEFGAFKTELLPWQEDMVRRCLDAVGTRMEA